MGRDPKARRETNERCIYHKDWGHVTENCEGLQEVPRREGGGGSPRRIY